MSASKPRCPGTTVHLTLWPSGQTAVGCLCVRIFPATVNITNDVEVPMFRYAISSKKVVNCTAIWEFMERRKVDAIDNLFFKTYRIAFTIWRILNSLGLPTADTGRCGFTASSIATPPRLDSSNNVSAVFFYNSC